MQNLLSHLGLWNDITNQPQEHKTVKHAISSNVSPTLLLIIIGEATALGAWNKFKSRWASKNVQSLINSFKDLMDFQYKNKPSDSFLSLNEIRRALLAFNGSSTIEIDDLLSLVSLVSLPLPLASVRSRLIDDASIPSLEIVEEKVLLEYSILGTDSSTPESFLAMSCPINSSTPNVGNVTTLSAKNARITV